MGRGVTTDYSKAFALFNEALEYDEEDDCSLFGLGLIYYYGDGVNVDKNKAMKLLQKAYDFGNDEALKYLV